MTKEPYFVIQNSDIKDDTIVGDVLVSVENVIWAFSESTSDRAVSLLRVQYPNSQLNLKVSSVKGNGKTVSDRFREAVKEFRDA